MEALARNISEENLLHPVIRQLEAHDQAYNTEYLVTLKTYIHACYSKSGTSRRLTSTGIPWPTAWRRSEMPRNTRDPMTGASSRISFTICGPAKGRPLKGPSREGDPGWIKPWLFAVINDNLDGVSGVAGLRSKARFGWLCG